MAADVKDIAMLLQPLVISKDEDNDLVSCSDAHFETKVNSLESSTLLNLVQKIQEAMGKEQVLFDSINQQLALSNKDSTNHKNLSTALCASQARLARLCARNMRCFMQAMKSQKPKEATGSAQAAAPTGVNSDNQQHLVPATQVGAPAVGSLAAVASSVDGLISSVKRLQTNHTAMVKSAFKQSSRPASLSSSVGNSSSGDDSDSPLYENVEPPNVYENLTPSPPQHIYDQPKINPKSVFEEDEAIYENVDFEKASTSSSGDEALYENVNSQGQRVTEEVTYDVPWNSQPIYANPNLMAKKSNLVPKSAKIVLETEGNKQLPKEGKDVDQDSLEDLDEPDIPSPDYGSDEDFQSGDFDLAGFSDPPHVDFHHFNTATSNYYNEDQGLAVILEEPEDEDEEEYDEEDCVSTLSTTSAGSASRASTPHEASKLDVAEDTPDGDLPRPRAIPKVFIPPPAAPEPVAKQPLLETAPKIVEVKEAKVAEVIAAKETVKVTETAPMTVKSSVAPTQTCHQTNETEPPMKEDIKEQPKEPEFQLPSVKNLRSHFEGANNSKPAQKEPAFVPKKFTSNKFNTRPTVLQKEEPVVVANNNNFNSNNNNNIIDRKEPEKILKEPPVAVVVNKEQERLPEVQEVRVVPLVKQVSFSEEPSNGSASVDTRSMTSNSVANTEDEDEEEEYVEPIMKQFSEEYEEEEILKPRPTTRSWDPATVLQEMYIMPEPLRHSGNATSSVTIEGYLDKLPSGKKKSTFWNAWKRRYFRAKDGYLYCYQNNQTEKPSISVQLMGGKVESLETNSTEDEQHPMVSKMLGIDDGKGHYIVVRCANKQEKERWRLALNTHTTENFNSTYVNPWPLPKDPALLKSTIIIDLGSCSTRAGILCSQATLPQIFFPTIMAVDKITKKRTFGADALKPEVRSTSSLQFPVKPSAKITKYSVDVTAIPGLFQKVFDDLNVDQRMYDVILSVPRSFNTKTQTEIVNILFDKFGVNAINMTHQSVLALYSYNATSGVVVDIGERMDIVPINEGYIVENGVSRIPYGGTQIVDHLRHFLHQKQYSLVTEVESFLIRFVLENLCYSSQHYNTEMQRFREDASTVEKSISIKEFFDDTNNHWESISLDSGRFQSTEGLFNPDAWGLDNLGVHKLVHRAIRECSMDVRKEMTRSIYLSGGVTMLPGFAERLHAEVDKVTPKSLQPKIHASPYRYHASYIGACVLANSPGVDQMKITKSEWQSSGTKALSKWSL